MGGGRLVLPFFYWWFTEAISRPKTSPRIVRFAARLQTIGHLYLMRSPGTDIWYPKSGGGVQKLVGAHFSRSNAGGVSAAFVTAVSRVKTQVMTLQASNTRLSASEKLGSVSVLSAVFNAQQTALLARVELGLEL